MIFGFVPILGLNSTRHSSANMPLGKQLRLNIIERALEDEDFKSKLLDDPKSAIEEGLGVTLPEDADIKVIERTSDTTYIYLPDSSKLSASQLARISGSGRSKHQRSGDQYNMTGVYPQLYDAFDADL